LAELFEKNNFTNIDIEKLTSNKLNGLLTQAFRYAQLDTTMHYKYFEFVNFFWNLLIFGQVSFYLLDFLEKFFEKKGRSQ